MDFYKSPHRGWKILDNGEAEPEGQISPGSLVDLAFTLDVHEIVVPDVLGNEAETLEKVRWFRDTLHSAAGDFRHMAVVQGENYSQWEHCWNVYMNEDWIDTIALPRIMNKFQHDARYRFAEKVIQWDSKPIHCLGASSWVKEVVMLSELPVVRGIDTSLPIVMGLEYEDITRDKYVSRQEGYFAATPNDLQMEVIERNVRTYLDWSKASSSAM